MADPRPIDGSVSDRAAPRTYSEDVSMKLGGALARRNNEPLGGYCPIERTLGLLTPHSTMLVLREAFYGAKRFDELVDARVSAKSSGDLPRALATEASLRAPPFKRSFR